MRKYFFNPILQNYRHISILIIVTLFTFPLFTQDFRNPPDLQVSIHPGFTYRAGSIGEHLFNVEGKGKPVSFAPSGTKQMSFLQWDINAMLETTLNVDFQYKSFVAMLNGRIGIPMQTGKMDDYDWDSVKEHQTHFSTHTNRITGHFVAGGLVGWEFSSENKSIKLLPMVGFNWQKTSMTASDGYRQYVPEDLMETTAWSDDLEKVPFKGDVISYAHEVFQVDCLLRLTYNHNSHFYFSLDGSIHPIISAYGFDNHLVRGLQFLDYDMKGQVGFGAAFTVGYQIIPKHFLTLKVDYNYLPVVTGPTYYKSISQKYYHPDPSSKGGASHWFVGVTLGWKFNIFE